MKHIEQTIVDLKAKITEHEKQVAAIKTTINSLCEIMGSPPLYSNIASEHAANGVVFRSDQFYGRPLATALRDILESRRAANLGPATVNDLYDGLVSGGYKFETKDEQNAKRGLRISLRKNPAFHRLPNGGYGLMEWYPNAKPEKEEDDEVSQRASERVRLLPEDDGSPAKVEINP